MLKRGLQLSTNMISLLMLKSNKIKKGINKMKKQITKTINKIKNNKSVKQFCLLCKVAVHIAVIVGGAVLAYYLITRYDDLIINAIGVGAGLFSFLRVVGVSYRAEARK
jgi:hypothetical protein